MKKRIPIIVILVLSVLALCFGIVACTETQEQHHLEKVEAKEATCEAAGNIEYYRCTDESCGKLFADAEGKTEITLDKTVIAKLDHKGGTATCTEQAVCEVCHNPYGEKAEHEWKSGWEQNAQGHYKICGVCEEEGTPVPHVPVDVVPGDAPTCTEPGLTAKTECDICGHLISDQTEIPAVGHTAEHRTRREATCEEDGYLIEHWYCTTCENYYSDEECENKIDEDEAVEPKSGHSYGDWVQNSDGHTHTRTCANNNAHTETADCSGGKATCQAKAECDDCHSVYGELGAHNTFGALEYDNESGHYTTCSVCGTRSETSVPHGLDYESDEHNHWKQCECGYTTDTEAHTAVSIAAEVKAESRPLLREGYVLKAKDVTVYATCECGEQYEITDGFTVSDTALVEGTNTVEVDYNGIKTTITVVADDAPANTLTLIGATFAGGGNTVELKAGEGLPVVTLAQGKGFYGFKDADQNYYTQETFVMPASALTITALYDDEMIAFAPSDVQNSRAKIDNTAEHKQYTDVKSNKSVVGTEITFKPQYAGPGDTEGREFNANASSDTKTWPVNVYAPAYGKTFMIVAIVNENNESYQIKYNAENWGVQGEILNVTVAANSTTYVPFRYGSDNNQGSFAGCDHQITMLSEIESDVKLGFYGYIAVDGRMTPSSIGVNLIKTIYDDGDTFDIANGLTVTAMLGADNYKVNVYNYVCSVADGQEWNESITEVVVSVLGVRKVIKLNDYSDWLSFTLSEHFKSQAGWVSQEHVNIESFVDGTTQRGSKLTFTPGATVATSSDFNIETHNDKSHKSLGYNVRVPEVSGKPRSVMFVVTNTGDNPISFWLGSDDGFDGVEITVRPGERNKRFYAVLAGGTTTGGWMKIKLLSDVVADGETTVEVLGYFKTFEGEMKGMRITSTSHKTAYQVGETLSTENLIVRPTEVDGFDVNNGDYSLNIANYKYEILDHEGNTFTEADAGKTFTVRVYWNNLETTYQVSVAAL